MFLWDIKGNYSCSQIFPTLCRQLYAFTKSSVISCGTQIEWFEIYMLSTFLCQALFAGRVSLNDGQERKGPCSQGACTLVGEAHE